MSHALHDLPPQCLKIASWRASTPEEVVHFFRSAGSDRPERAWLIVESRLRPVDVYSYLMARFGRPNGFQNFLRRDDSDNIVHWDYNLKASDVDVYFAGAAREVHIAVSEPLTDEQWKTLILTIKTDFQRVSKAKSKVMKSFEKYVLFQNKYVSLAGLCADLHAEIIEAPQYERPVLNTETEDTLRDYYEALKRTAERATKLFGSCLKLSLLTPVMAEAYINMLILIFCKDNIRDNGQMYQNFVRAKFPHRIAVLNENCYGFERPIDTTTSAYAAFMRVIQKRNFALHGNVDPDRDKIEVIYFDGRRPLFTDPGNHIEKFFGSLERSHTPERVIAEYEEVHAFLAEITQCLSETHQAFLEQVINDAYPGYDLKRHRVTRLLPDHIAMGILPGMRRDRDLKVEW